MLVLDTDIASAFAKADALDLILKLFKSGIHITPEVYEELQVPLSYGYMYPKEIFDKVKILDLTPEEQRSYRDMLNENINLGKGELESISVCIERDCTFSSLDKNAIKFAEKKKVKVIVLKAILKGLWKNKVCSEKEVRDLVNKIEEEDNRTIDSGGVFDD